MRVLDDLTEALGPLVPALGDTPVAEHRGGLFTMTPDARFLAGPVPGVHGLWTATGCNGSGFSISAGIGRALAEWIVGGEPTIDMSSLDPGRFGPGPIDDDELTSAGLWQLRELLHAATGGLTRRRRNLFSLTASTDEGVRLHAAASSGSTAQDCGRCMMAKLGKLGKVGKGYRNPA